MGEINQNDKQIDSLIINGKNLTPEDVAAVSYNKKNVKIDPSSYNKIEKEYNLFLKVLQKDISIYGVTTGTGANKNVRIPSDQTERFQKNILLSHSVGIDEYYTEEEVRAILIVRVNSLLCGGTGVQPQIVKMYVDFLNKGIHPITPKKGSVGTGDLGPLAEQGLAFIGEGNVYYNGEKTSSLKALQSEKLTPVQLGPKDGMILSCNSSVTIGIATLLLVRIEGILDQLDASACLSLEAFQGNVSPLKEEVLQYRPYPGNMRTARNMKHYLKNSFLWDKDVKNNIQDPLSFRCIVQVYGSFREVFQFAKTAIELELNSVVDNPLLIKGDFIHHGNFHMETIMMRFDFLGIQIASVANIIQNRLQRLMTPEFSHLPKFLINNPGMNSGFSTLQKTYTQLTSEIRHLSNPASIDIFNTANGVEDHGGPAPYVIQKTIKMIEKLEYIIGIELMVAAQGIDLVSPSKQGQVTKAVYKKIRQYISPLCEDRLLRNDIEKAQKLVNTNKILNVIRSESEKK